MPSVRDFCDRLWNGEVDTVTEAHPLRWLHLEGEEIADGVLFYKGIASATTVDSGESLVMLDTGSAQDTERLHGVVRGWKPDLRLAAAVFSHHHVDHIFGVGPFEREAAEKGQSGPLVYGHEAIAGHLDRYSRMGGWNTAINKRQFAIAAPNYRWPEEFRYPDITYREHLTFREGELTFELHHTRGETEDATWTWIPEKRLLTPGDLFIWAVPNAGNPQKVQRYIGEWAAGLRQMAGLDAELMVAGHGFPIFGAGRIKEALTETANLLETIEQQVVAMMNTGASLDTVLHSVEIPAASLEKPYLRPVYDHPQFLIRNVWRLYGGWHDGEPDNLLPAPRVQQAKAWVELAGGVENVLKKVRALRDEGDLRLACHLVEYAALAEPASGAVHELRTEVYRARSQQQTSSMARNILNHAALASEQGKRDLAGDW